MNEMLFSLGLIALLTSMLSAVTGVGGGILLLSGLTLYLPPQAIVPIHGVIQTELWRSSRAVLAANSLATHSAILERYVARRTRCRHPA